MKGESPSVTSKLWSISAILAILILWQLSISFDLVKGFMLPSPIQITEALTEESPVLMRDARVTLTEAGTGLVLGITAGFGAAALMGRFDKAHRAFYPIVIPTQTVSAVAITPLLVLQFDYEMTSKTIPAMTTTFFSITVGLLTGFRAVGPDTMNLLKTTETDRFRIFCYIKLSGATGQSSSNLETSTLYVMMGAVISEWLSGLGELGVYMTRVKRALSSGKTFVVAFLISAINLILMWTVGLFQKKYMPWEASQRQKQNVKQISGVSLRGEIENEK